MTASLVAQSVADRHTNSATIWERLSVLCEFATAPQLLVYVQVVPSVTVASERGTRL